MAFFKAFTVLATVFIALQFPVNCGAFALAVDNLTIKDGLSGRYVRAVAQDSKGFIWLGTEAGVSRFDGYQFVTDFGNEEVARQLAQSEVWALEADVDGTVWVGTQKKGLFQIINGQASRPVVNKISDKVKAPLSVKRLKLFKGRLLIGSENGLLVLDGGELKNINDKQLENKTVTSMIIAESGMALISTFYKLYELDQNFGLREVESPSLNKGEFITKLYSGEKGTYVITNKAAYKAYQNKFIPYFTSISDERILSINDYQSRLYISTLKGGLYEFIAQESKNIQLLTEFNSSEIITTMFNDDSSTLWLGTFDNGVLKHTARSRAFTSRPFEDMSCFDNLIVQSFLELNDSSILIGTNKGPYILSNETCRSVSMSSGLKGGSVWSSGTIKNITYLAIGKQLALLRNGTAEKFKDFGALIYDIKEFNKGILVSTAGKGVFYLNLESGSVKRLPFKGEHAVSVIYEALVINSSIYLATEKGLYKSGSGALAFYPVSKDTLGYKVNSIMYKDKYIYLATNDKLVKRLNLENNKLEYIVLDTGSPSFNVESYVSEPEGVLWVSTTKGLYRQNMETNSIEHYVSTDGVGKGVFTRGSSYRLTDGTILFGRRKGLTTVDVKELWSNRAPPRVVLTEVGLNNEELLVREGVLGNIIKSEKINSALEFNHKTYLISLTFSALQYASPERIKYQYKLKGFHDEWVKAPENGRTATFTNLKPGNYNFLVKAQSIDGVWSTDATRLNLPIIVHPAPWFSWWAYTIYILTIIGCVLLFIRYRIKSATERARVLKIEVAKRTKEINTQKTVIESLLERKNEIFTNISHEFRTPLTLILGPLAKEIENPQEPKNLRNLDIIKRNASRLLGMVEQILKLSELKKEGGGNKVPREINTVINDVVKAFTTLSELNKIKLKVQLGGNCNVMLIEDTLEVVLGNLISNAIKYTPQGGQVIVETEVNQSEVNIYIRDNGVGIEEGELDRIFERFERINETSDIAGTGVGLSIVKELVVGHQGKVVVDSKKGEGATFKVTLPITNKPSLSREYRKESIRHLTDADTSKRQFEFDADIDRLDTGEGRPTILIIDDNLDMRQYIASSLGSSYQFEFAARGGEGLEKSKATIPDLVVCDVMMPGIDGFEVARELRDNNITSHIPILLLTAKGDKESRIHGWNKNVDGYMTKPFDEFELKSRIENILTVRSIISKRLGEEITTITGSRVPSYQDKFTKRDKVFLDKLKEDISDNYRDPRYSRAKMASAVALSERQFQRKLRALINKSPTEILREYRLKVAAELLASGEPAGVVADKCGFSSASHFSVTFKAFYDVTPSQYQAKNKKLS